SARDARQSRPSGSDCRVGEPSRGGRGGEPGPRAEGTAHAPALPRGARVEPDPPRQPGGAGEKAGVPAAARVELDGMDSSRDLNGIDVPKSPCVHRPLWKEESR